jgi:hypothetical protein
MARVNELGFHDDHDLGADLLLEKLVASIKKRRDSYMISA